MDLTVPSAALSELAAAFLQAAITVGLAALCAFLYRRYRKPYFGYWALAWVLYALRLGAIISFILTERLVWLYWHQVTTGWVALALLWAAFVFSQQLRWRPQYVLLILFPPVWSYVAIYQMDHFLLAAGPAVLFLSLATLWTGWAFYRYHRQVRSVAAAGLAVALLLWGLHHLDYPFLRARGVWNPWGYYLDALFELALGAGILLLVQEDLERGIGTLSALSGDLQHGVRDGAHRVLDRLLERPLTLPGVRGSAIYMLENGRGAFVRGIGSCATWTGMEPRGGAGTAVARVVETGRPEVARDWIDEGPSGVTHYAYGAALPVLRGTAVTGALVIVGDARDPFAALDAPFLLALGQQVGAALESADLYQRLQDRTRELEWLARRMLQQHEDERRRLSRELHDETAQVFSAVKLHLAVLRESAEPGLAERLDRALELIDTGIRSIRNVTRDLRPSLLDDLGLQPALRALVDEFGERSGVFTRISQPDSLPAVSPEGELALFRALQEGLANVTRHAEATSVVVMLSATGSSVTLAVRDDGKGMAHTNWQEFERLGHVGLAGMRERIAQVGGSVTVQPASGGGVELSVSVPTMADVADEQ